MAYRRDTCPATITLIHIFKIWIQLHVQQTDTNGKENATYNHEILYDWKEWNCNIGSQMYETAILSKISGSETSFTGFISCSL